MKIVISLVGLLNVWMFTSCGPGPGGDTDLEIQFGKVSYQAVFSSDTMSIWGGSLIKGDDGQFHLFYSRWPKHLGWVWVSHSEIAHAVSDSAFGPFSFQDVALPDRGGDFWDGGCTHNPTIHRFNGKYYLYYMGNMGDKKVMGNPGKPELHWGHRNQQRIGVAVAESPDGPWERFSEPVLNTTENDSLAFDALMVSNPSVCAMPDGRILLVYKAVGKQYPLPAGGPVVHGVAIADSPTGPFTKYPEPIFTVEGERFPAEDPYIWYQEGKFRAIVKRMSLLDGQRHFTLVHFDSEDGIHWQEARFYELSDRTITWEDGRTQQFTHLGKTAGLPGKRRTRRLTLRSRYPR